MAEDEVNIDKMLERVRLLIQKAEHPSTPPEEADACRSKADSLMLKYALDSAMLDASRPAAARMKPGRIEVDLGLHGDPIIYEIVLLGHYAAKHCRCKSIWIQSYFGVDTLRVYGYESDLRYFELLYTTLYLHMSRVLSPKIDPDKSLEENAYNFRNAGLNWIDIAKLYGWVRLPKAVCDMAYKGEAMFCNKDTGNIESIMAIWQYYRTAYYRAIRERGEESRDIPFGESGTPGYRKNAAKGYVSEIRTRLARARGERAAGTELVLKDRSEEIDKLITDMEGNIGPAHDNSDNVAYNQAAYDKGREHAMSADISPAGPAMGSSTAGALE